MGLITELRKKRIKKKADKIVLDADDFSTFVGKRDSLKTRMDKMNKLYPNSRQSSDATRDYMVYTAEQKKKQKKSDKRHKLHMKYREIDK